MKNGQVGITIHAIRLSYLHYGGCPSVLLGRGDFFEVSNKLFQEMKHAGVVENQREWNLVQRTFLHGYCYYTGYSKATREAGKQRRLNEIVEQLKRSSRFKRLIQHLVNPDSCFLVFQVEVANGHLVE